MSAQSVEMGARLRPEDYDALFDVLATIEPVRMDERARFVGYFDTPDGRRVAEVVESIIAKHLPPAPPAIRLGSCCFNVGTDACTCARPTNWGRVTPPASSQDGAR